MSTISLLTNDDLPTAFLIEQASHQYPWSKKIFFSNRGERYLNLKLTVSDQIVGFAITQLVLDEATLFNIAIAPKYQQQGLGKKLLSGLIELLRSRAISTLWLEVRASNRSAIALYESLGFNEVAVRENYYPTKGGQEDAIIMALYL